MPSPFARQHNLDIVRDILTIAGLEGIRGRTDVVTVAGTKGRLSTQIMQYKDVEFFFLRWWQ